MIKKELYRKYYLENYSAVKSYFLHKGFPPEDAEELTQETFLRVFRYRGDLKGSDSFRSWLNTIASNLWKNRIRELRAIKRDAPVVSIDVHLSDSLQLNQEQEGARPLDQVIDKQHRQLLRQAVSQLSETTHACVVLRVFHELSYKEIATVLQIPYDTVKSRLHQAQAQLRQLIGNELRIK